MRARSRLQIRLTLVLLATVLVGACQSTGRLGEYQFAGRTLLVVYDFPPRPELLTGPYFPGHPDDAVHPLMRLAGRVAKEVAASGARETLDAACEKLDIAAVVADRTSERAGRFMRADLVTREDEADFGLEVRVLDYGIDAEEWEAAAHFFVHAEVILFDALDGSEIWRSSVRERDPITAHVFGNGRARVARDVITAAALGAMTESDMIRALEGLGEYVGDRISERLRQSLEEVRRGRD